MNIAGRMTLPVFLALLTVAPSAGQAPSALPDIYVVDSANDRVVLISSRSPGGRTTYSGGPDRFGGVEDVALDSKGRIYVADFRKNWIVRIDDMAGKGWTALGSEGDGIKQFFRPLSISLDSAGRIYVADFGNKRVVRFEDMNGAGWTVAPRIADPNPSFFSVAVDSRGRIYVAHDSEGRILRMDDITGAGLVTYGGFGRGRHQFDPVAVALDRQGRILVADHENRRIVRIDDMDGAGWIAFGTRGNGRVGEFEFPTSIAEDKAGRIYVADYGNCQIVRINDMTGLGWTTIPFGARDLASGECRGGPGNIAVSN